MRGSNVSSAMAKKKLMKRKNLVRLKAYGPIIRLLSEGGGKNNKKSTSHLQKCILSILPEHGLDVVCECLHNAIHSKSVEGESLKKLASIKNPNSIRALASTTKDIKKRRKNIVDNSEDVAKTLSSVFPLLKQVVRGSDKKGKKQ